MKNLTGIVLFCLLLSGCEFWEVDKCLDRGGRWDYEGKECDFGDDAENSSTNSPNES